MLDFGAPRVDDTYRVLRGTRPNLLFLLSEDLVGTNLPESTPTLVGGGVHYYKVVAVDRCGQQEDAN